MYFLKTLVKHGVQLVGGSRRNRGTVTTSETSTSAITAPVPPLPMRGMARSLPSFRAVPHGAQMRDWERARLISGVPFVRPTSSIAVSSPRSALDGVEAIARESPAGGGEESVSKFDVSSNCVTPVFRVSPFVQKTSVIFAGVCDGFFRDSMCLSLSSLQIESRDCLMREERAYSCGFGVFIVSSGLGEYEGACAVSERGECLSIGVCGSHF